MLSFGGHWGWTQQGDEMLGRIKRGERGEGGGGFAQSLNRVGVRVRGVCNETQVEENRRVFFYIPNIRDWI